MTLSQGDLLLDMVPRFFILPRDYDEFKADLDRNPGRLYIQKVRSCTYGCAGARLGSGKGEGERGERGLRLGLDACVAAGHWLSCHTEL